MKTVGEIREASDATLLSLQDLGKGSVVHLRNNARSAIKRPGPSIWSEGEREMTEKVLPSVFTIEISGTPTLTFEANNLREAHELCREEWLKQDLSELKTDGASLWDGKAKLRARIALPDEIARFAEAKNSGHQSVGLVLVYLVEVDG
jgi:hypothetical protein